MRLIASGIASAIVRAIESRMLVYQSLPARCDATKPLVSECAPASSERPASRWAEVPKHVQQRGSMRPFQPTVSCDYVEADYVGTNVSCRWYNSHVCTMNYC